MSQNFLDSTTGAETIGWVFLEQLLNQSESTVSDRKYEGRAVGTYASNEVFALVRHGDVVTGLVREVHGLLLDQLVHLGVGGTTSVEGREAHNHFIGKNTQGPPVDGEAVAALNQNLRRQVVRGTTEREGLSVALEDLGQTEICEADVTIFVHQDVLGLQITVDDVFLVQVTEGHCDLNGVEAGSIFIEAGDIAQVHEQLTATHEPHHEEDFLLSLEHVAHAHEEGVVSLQQDVLFQTSRLDLVVLDDNILTQRLHSVNFLRSSLLDKEDFTEGASTNDRLDNEVRKCDVLVSLGVDERWAVIAASGQLIVVIGRRVLLRWSACNGFVEILTSQAEAVGRKFVHVGLSIGLGSAVLLQFTWDAVDRQVLVVEMEVAGLDLLEHLVAKLTNEAVIVLALDMHNEFFVAGLSALGQSHHFL